MKKALPFAMLVVVVILALIFPSVHTVNITGNKIDSGDTAWMLTSTALVLIMTPGLAFFYGGMVNKKKCIKYHDAKFCMYGRNYRNMGNIWF